MSFARVTPRLTQRGWVGAAGTGWELRLKPPQQCSPLAGAAAPALKCFARQDLKLITYMGEPGLKKSQAQRHLAEWGLTTILPGGILLGTVLCYCRDREEL